MNQLLNANNLPYTLDDMILMDRDALLDPSNGLFYNLISSDGGVFYLNFSYDASEFSKFNIAQELMNVFDQNK